MDSMNLWIEIARDSLVQTISGVDCVILNDAELRQLTEKPNLVAAAREVLAMGPSVIVAKQGEYGAALITADEFFSLPAYPLETVVDPTGAGDTFAGGFVGWLAKQPGRLPHRDGLRDRAGVLQRRGVRHRARAAPDAARGRGARERPGVIHAPLSGRAARRGGRFGVSP